MDAEEKQSPQPQGTLPSTGNEEVTDSYPIEQLNAFFEKNADMSDNDLDLDSRDASANACPPLQLDELLEKIAESTLLSAAEESSVDSDIKTEQFGRVDSNAYVVPGVLASPDEESSLSYHQRLLLDTVARLSDNEVFEESHPGLAANESLPPSEYIEPLALAPEPIISPLDSLLEADAGNFVVSHARLRGDPPSGLINRDQPDAYRAPLNAPKSEPIKPLTIEAKIGIGIVLLALPLFGFAVFEQTQANSEVDKQQQIAAVDFADEAAEVTAQNNQVQEPFRMPAGAGTGSGGRTPGAEAEVGAVAESGDLDAGWRRPTHPNAEPTPEQVDQGKRIMDTAEQMQSLGKDGQATALLSAALGQCPGNVMLRIATCKAYIRLGQNKTALVICQEGMKNARSSADYSLLRALLPQIPA